jgi:fibronectin type 3 domain-containing protein
MSSNRFKMNNSPAAVALAARRVRLPQPIAVLEALESRRLLAADVLGYHGGDLASNGVNANETILTPGNVKSSTFGKQFAVNLDGQGYSEPLLKRNVNITTGANQGLHDVLFVATEHDSLYAIDANGGTVLWHDSFITNAAGNPNPLNANIPAGVTSVPQPDVNSGDISVEIGITSTPVIDPNTGFLYLTAKTKENTNHYVYRLHKINIQNGVDTSVVIGDTQYSGGTYTYRTSGAATDPYVVGNGAGAITVGGQSRVYFNALRQMNRPGLQIQNGRIWTMWASHGDNGPYHGWVLTYDASTLALNGVLNTTPNGSEGEAGIWQAGGAPVFDSNGFLYFETGNGLFDGYNGAAGSNHTATVTGLDVNGFPVNGDYGDSFIKVALDATTTQTSQNKNGWGLKVVDYFSPFNNIDLDQADRDLGSGGPIVLPDSAGSAAHPHLLIGSGKEGKLYLIDRDNMGKFGNTDHVVQTVGSALSGSLDTPCYFNGRLYYMEGYGGPVKSWSLTGGMIGATAQNSPDSLGQLNGTPIISANGITNGILWAVDRGTNQLRAYDASNLSNELWTSGQNSARDSLGAVVKFTTPTVANGRVFVDTASQLVAYGPPMPPTSGPADPTNLVATAVSGSQINLTWHDNATNEDGYLVEQSNDGGTTWNQIASLSVNSTGYQVGGLQLATTYSFRVRAFNSFNTLSYSNYTTPASATTSSLPATLDYSNGFANAGTTIKLNGNAAVSGTGILLTPNAGSQVGSFWAATQQDDTHFSTTFSFQLGSGSTTADGFTFCIQNVPAGSSAIGAVGGALGYGTIGTSSVAIKFDIYPNSSTTGLYSAGANPGEDANSLDMSTAGIDLHSGDVFNVSLTYDGTTLQETVSDATTGATYIHNYTVNIPSLVGGNTAFVGFTGATGGQFTTQNIKTWTYTPTTQTPPAAPSNLILTVASGTEIDLNWTDNANNETAFKVYRSTDGVNFSASPIGTTLYNVTEYIDSGLTPNTQYWYRVSATNPSGDSAFATAGPAVTPVPPLVPTKFAASNVTSSTAHISWQDNATNEQGYKVLRRTGTGQFIQIAALPPDSTSYDDSGLTPGTAYDYHVQCYNVAGYSDFAGGTITTTTTAPTGLVATAGAGMVTLSWNAPSAGVPSSYGIYRFDATHFPSTPTYTGITATNFVDTAVTPGVEYLYKIVAINAGGESNKTVGAAATPTAPQAIIAGRYVFYNGSSYDGGDETASTADDAAIATDKSALLPGQTATAANYTTYSKGINGVMIDVSGLANAAGISAADFTFTAGTAADPTTWAAAPAPNSISVRPSPAGGGVQRITLIWDDNAIQNQWLKVSVNPTGNTGLSAADVFYLGNLIGDANGNGQVTVADTAMAKSLQGTATDITSATDFNRSGQVTVADVAIAKAYQGFSIPLLSAPTPAPTAPAAAPASVVVTPVAAPEATTVTAATTTTTATKRRAPAPPSPSRGNAWATMLRLVWHTGRKKNDLLD